MKKPLPQNYDRNKLYSIEEAVALLPELSTSKFVGSVDLDIVLNLTDKQRKESMSGSVVLPNQFGEQKRIIVIADEKDAKTAKAAGAVDAGLADVIKNIESGKVQFDLVIATPAVMPQVAKLGKVLGPKGLMPNPNNGTVAEDVEAAVKTFLSGKMNFKMSEQGAVRTRVAKVDMKPEQIIENTLTYVGAIFAAARKFGAQPFKKVTISPTQGAGVKIDVASLMEKVA